MRSKTRNSLTHDATPVSLKDFVIPETIIDFPKSSVVPAGFYFSEIIDIQPRLTNSGKKCVDVTYEIQGFREEQGDHVVRMSYPEGSRPLQDLYKAMRNAGVPAGSSLEAAIGVQERIQLVYDDEDSIGRIHRRVYDPPQANNFADEEEEEE